MPGPKAAHPIVAMAAVGALTAFACLPAQGVDTGMARNAVHADANTARTTGTKSSPIRSKKKSASLKAARYRDVTYLRKPTANGIGRYVCRSNPDNACTVISWNGLSRTTSTHSEFDRMALASQRFHGAPRDPAIALKPPEQTTPADPSALMPTHDRSTNMVPPGRDVSYKVSFNLPFGKYESLNLQAGIRKDQNNAQASSDQSLRAAWSVKF